MVTGDEPSLSPPHGDEDNSPMLSSNRLLMDARAAYEAGWLLGLTERMSEAQQLRFRQAITLQAMYWIVDSIIITELLVEEDDVLQQVARWIYAPTAGNVRDLLHICSSGSRNGPEPIDYESLYDALYWSEIPHPLSALIWCIIADSLLEAAKTAAQVAAETIEYPWREPDNEFWVQEFERRPPPLADGPQRRREAQRWQVEAAWAILHDEEPPPLTFGGRA